MKKFLVVISILFLAYHPLYANNISKRNTSEEPIDIISDSLITDHNNNTALFEGNVRVKQGNITITSNQMTVYYVKDDVQKAENKFNSSIDKITFIGSVFIDTGNEKAYSNKGIYSAISEKIELTGDVKLHKDENIILGEKFIYDLKNDKSNMISSQDNTSTNGKVRAILHPKNKDKAK